jgi:anti-sigma factor RsiW
MKKDDPFTEDDVHDYVDGRMSRQRRQEFETFLEMNSEIAGVVEAYKRQNQMLRALV